MHAQADLTEPDVLAFHRRAELAAFFYIEAASKVELDHRWEVFYLYAPGRSVRIAATATVPSAL